MVDPIQRKFKDLFQQSSTLVAAPGRVNLIGEHTDYNEGFVLPAAIDKQIIFAIAENGTNQIRLHADVFDQTLEFSLDDLAPSSGWVNYMLGVVAVLLHQGHQVRGFNCVMGGDIPIGAGMSSSAALECGLVFALDHIYDLRLDRMEMARIGQQAEHTYVGVQCGIMDQFASLLGKKDQLLKLDCRSLDYEYIPFNFPGYKIVLCNSMVDHSLASSQYNVRRQQCEEGVEILKKIMPGITTLRDVTSKELGSNQGLFPPVIYQRCTYVLAENSRVLKSCDLLKQGHLDAFGKLMYDSHMGLSKLYEVSCPELDYLVELTLNRPEVIGARMMGGGFGGCTINIVKAEAIGEFSRFIEQEYEKRFSRTPDIHITSIETGTHLIS